MKVLLKDRYFLLGLLLRFLLLPFFASEVARDLFIPFLDRSILHLGTNPWSMGDPREFPYGSFLFAILFATRWLFYILFGSAALGAGYLGLISLKLPLLIADISIYATFKKLNPFRNKELLFFYWFNPICIYISYVHAQLDSVAMSLCILSIYFITKGRIAPSAFAISAAILSKAHIILVIPLIISYLISTNFRKQAAALAGKWLAIISCVVGVGYIPLFFAERLTYVTFASPEALKLFSLRVAFGDTQIVYIGLAVVFILMGRLYSSLIKSPQVLFYGTGILFSGLLLTTSAMPGWYYWVLPFFALFYIEYSTPPKLLWATLHLGYFLYFGFYSSLTSLSIIPEQLKIFFGGATYTLLQVSVFGIVVFIWKLVIKSDAPLERKVKPFALAIAGDSGSGKSYVSHILRDIFRINEDALLEGDDYHKWERGASEWKKMTHLNPHANYLNKLATHTSELVRGRAVIHPQYDHHTGKFTKPRLIKPERNLIIQGLHSLYLRGMRDYLDLKIFLYPSEDVRKHWKISRDVQERGHNIDTIMKSMEDRKPDSTEHIKPQKYLADWIIEMIPGSEKNANMIAKHTLWNDVGLERLLSILHNHQITCKVYSDPEDFNRTCLEIDGNPSQQQIGEISTSMFPYLKSLTRASQPPLWRKGQDGLIQIITLMLVDFKLMRSEEA